jgi:hypothetical protein
MGQTGPDRLHIRKEESMPRFIVISTDWDEQTHFVDYVSATDVHLCIVD